MIFLAHQLGHSVGGLVGITDYIYKINAITGKLDKVVNNLSVLKAGTDLTDPTSGGGAANGRIPVTINGATVYIAYYL